jgi:methylmalonyl-CoA/ethylmalonyl-CoA epimerase
MLFQGLDHIAIVVSSTEDALAFYRDRLGFPVVASEIVNDPPVRLTHLDMGNAHLQLVEPMTPDQPLNDFLAQRGEALHHICFKVDNVPQAMADLPRHGLQPRAPIAHAGVNGRQAAFIDPAGTRGILIEITSEPDGD